MSCPRIRKANQNFSFTKYRDNTSWFDIILWCNFWYYYYKTIRKTKIIMNIKFLKLLIPRSGKVTEALFEVGDKDIKIGVTDTFIAVSPAIKDVESFLRQCGKLMIRKMLLENNLSNYTFKAYNFTKTDNQRMSPEEIKEKLESEIIKLEEKQDSIGFKI